MSQEAYTNVNIQTGETIVSPREAHTHFNRVGGGLLAVIIILGAIAVSLSLLMTSYAKKLFDNVSGGQNDLCNFYTCSNEDSPCGYFPFTYDEEGNKVCLR